MDEKVLEQIQFHTDTVEADSNSPLHLIREKEMEISGRVLAAKKQAEEIVAEARKAAVKVIEAAEVEGQKLSAEQEKLIQAEVEKDLERIGRETAKEVEELGGLVEERIDTAVEFVVGAVTRG